MRGAWLVGLGLMGCGADAPAERDVAAEVVDRCTTPCFDGDPCTDDRCEAATGACVFVPRNPERACQHDRHCEVDDPCVIGRCAVDSCGLDRCVTEVAAECTVCEENVDCDDADPCSIDVCVGGTCRTITSSYCEPRCFDGRLGPGEVRLEGIAWSEPCACECDSGLLLQPLDVEATTLAFDGLVASGCTTTCEPFSTICEPLDRAEKYVVWGAWSADPSHLDVHGWCMSQDRLDVSRTWTGKLVQGAVESELLLHVEDSTAATLEGAPCDACPLRLGTVATRLVRGAGHARELPFVLQDGDTSIAVRAYLYPTPDGFSAPVVRVDGPLGQGTVVAVLVLRFL